MGSSSCLALLLSPFLTFPFVSFMSRCCFTPLPQLKLPRWRQHKGALCSQTSRTGSPAHWHQWEPFHSPHEVCSRPRRSTEERRQFGCHIFPSSRALHRQTLFNVTSAAELEIFVPVKWISTNNYRGFHAVPGWVWEWSKELELHGTSEVMDVFITSFLPLIAELEGEK